MLLAFFHSAYEAGARLACWDTDELRVGLVPNTPDQLKDLHAGAAATFGRAPAPQRAERSTS